MFVGNRRASITHVADRVLRIHDGRRVIVRADQTSGSGDGRRICGLSFVSPENSDSYMSNMRRNRSSITGRSEQSVAWPKLELNGARLPASVRLHEQAP